MSPEHCSGNATDVVTISYEYIMFSYFPYNWFTKFLVFTNDLKDLYYCRSDLARRNHHGRQDQRVT
jgi:hypothetical protein